MSRRKARALALIATLTLAPAALAYGAGTGTSTRLHRAPGGAAAVIARAATSPREGTAARLRAGARLRTGARFARTDKKPTKKLEKALATCRKKPKAGRRSCERKARRRYARQPAAKPREAHERGEENEEAQEQEPEGEKGLTGEGGGTEGKNPTANTAEELQRAAGVGAPTPAGVEAGRGLFAQDCEGCHGPTGTGGDGGPNLNELPRAHSVTGVIEQLVEPIGPMTNFDKILTFEEKEELANFVTVEITHAAQD